MAGGLGAVIAVFGVKDSDYRGQLFSALHGIIQ